MGCLVKSLLLAYKVAEWVESSDISLLCKDQLQRSYFPKFLAYFVLLYRSLVQRLEKVDPRKLKREEKLAFWINIHNALVMHVRGLAV